MPPSLWQLTASSNSPPFNIHHLPVSTSIVPPQARQRLHHVPRRGPTDCLPAQSRYGTHQARLLPHPHHVGVPLNTENLVHSTKTASRPLLNQYYLPGFFFYFFIFRLPRLCFRYPARTLQPRLTLTRVTLGSLLRFLPIASHGTAIDYFHLHRRRGRHAKAYSQPSSRATPSAPNSSVLCPIFLLRNLFHPRPMSGIAKSTMPGLQPPRHRLPHLDASHAPH